MTASAAVTANSNRSSRDRVFCSENLEYKPHHGPDVWREENIQHVVDLWQLDAEAEEYLRDLQRRVADIDHFKNDPHTLVRFMHGPWGYKEAENKFRMMMEWRLKNNVDTILDDYVPSQLLLDCLPTAILEDFDRDGDPIYVERGGSVDAHGLLKMFSKQELIRHAIWTRERNTNGVWINDYEQREGKHVRGITVVYDLKGLGPQHLTPKWIEHSKELARITQEYFPNPIKKMIFIRAPKIFTIAWNIAKHFFPPQARAKMIFVGNTGYLDVLDKFLDIKVLPRSIYEEGTGDTAIGMMQHLDGVNSIHAYIEANYPSKVSTTDTEEGSLSSDSQHGLVTNVREEESSSSDSHPIPASNVRAKLLFRGRWEPTTTT